MERWGFMLLVATIAGTVYFLPDCFVDRYSGNCGCVESRGHGEYLRYGELKDVRIWAWQ